MGRRHLFTQTVALLTVLAGTLAVPTSTVLAKDVTLKQTYVNHKKELKGGTLKIGYPSNNNFKGIFIQELGTDSETDSLAELGQPGLFRKDKNGKYVKGGLADVSFDRGSKTALITIGPKTRWSDGEPVTARDVAFVYEIIANKDSTSEYYSENLETIMGMKEYHEGKTDQIAGLQIKDSKHLLIHYTKMAPAMEYVDSGYLYNDAQPYHYLKDVPMAEMAQSDKVRKHPLFFGPYTIKKVVQGEAIEWVPNKYYGGRKPKLDKVVEEVVPVAQVAEAMRSHKYDIILHESRATYAKTSKVDQYVTLGTMAYGLQYMGFRVGDKNPNGKSVLDKELVTNNRALRLALAYAMNTQQIVEEYGAGLQKWANSMVSPAYGAYHDSKTEPYYQNLKKAEHLLDQAGFKRGKDGYRTRPDGKKLTLHLLDQASGRGNDEIRANYMQLWKKIGVKVELKDGRLQEFNSYIEQLVNDGKGFDVWLSNWAVPMPPTTSVAGNYMPSDPYNFAHFVTKENTELIESLSSKKAFNDKYQLKQFYKWQEYMNKEAYIVPRQFRYSTYVFSKKLTNISLKPKESYNLWENIAFTK